MKINNSEKIETTLHIDDSIMQLAELSTVLFDSSDAIQTKIDLIKEELAAGRYHINSTHIASKLLEFAEVSAEAVLD